VTIADVTTLGKLSKLGQILWSPLYRSAFLRYGVAAAVENEPALRPLGCSTVVDVGASRGQFSLVARRCFPRAAIIAFEPLLAPATRYRRVFSRDPDASLHQVALGRCSALSSIHVSKRDDSSSLLPITTTQQRIFPGTGESGTACVRVARLAEFLRAEELKAPALLKLDVQGYELEALKGCEDLLEYISYVYAEVSFMELYSGQALADDVICWLRDRRFRLIGVFGAVCDGRGRAVQADMLFRRASGSIERAGGGFPP
jgi:FkbM family methyltransferase